jgi:hypothetical protein
MVDDGCGGQVDCGTCNAGYTCVANACCALQFEQADCQANVDCGSIPNGCGGVVDCGGCSGGLVCQANACAGGDPAVCPGRGLTFNGSCATASGDTMGHTNKSSDCTADAGDLVYAFVATATATVSVAASGFNGITVAVYRDGCTAGTSMICDSPLSGSTVNVSFSARAGTQYFVFVGGDSSSNEGPFTLDVCYP